jgi:hypothetical protein
LIFNSDAAQNSHAPIEVALPELVKAAIAAHAVNPKLHKVLNEEVPRIGRLKQVTNAEEKINTLLRAYLEQRRDRILPQNLDLAVFILGRTVEALTHAVAIERPDLLDDGQIEQEITNLLLSYLVGT